MLNRSCCFDAQPRRRGLPTGYVRAVEIFLGLIFHSIDGIEDRATAILRGERGLPSWHSEQSSPLLVNSLADSWRRSGTMKELEQVLAGVDTGDESELSTRDLYEKLEGAFMERLNINDDCNTRASLLSPPRTSTPPALQQPTYDMVADNASAMHTVADETPLIPSFRNGNEPMDLPHDWSHLLDRYFTDTHAWFPIAPKHDVLRQAFCLANSNLDIEDLDCVVSKGDRAALFATLAYACYRNTLSDHDPSELVEDSFAPSEESQHEAPSMSLAGRLQNEAMSILNQGNDQVAHDAGHVQALLVLTILQVDQGSLTQAWITIGQAVHIAVILKIIPSSLQQAERVVTDKQRRLFLGIYILETLIAFTLERRPYLQKTDLAMIGLLPVDSIEEWEAWRPLNPRESTTGRETRTPGRLLSTFNAFLDLVAILNDQAHGLHSLEETLGRVQSWKTNHPSARPKTLSSIEVITIETPPQTLNLMIASLSIDAFLQIKLFLAQKNSQSPAALLSSPAPARESIEAIIRHRRVVIPSKSCPLMTIYMSLIESQVDIQGRTCNLSNLQHLPEPNPRLIRPANDERSLGSPSLLTATAGPAATHPAVGNTVSDELQVFEDFSGNAFDTRFSDKSLFDSLSFLDTADCSHQSGRFLENLGISSEVTPFDIEALFGQ